MSHGKPSAQVLRAQTVRVALDEVEDDRQERMRWWRQDGKHRDVPALLNHGFPFGLTEADRGLILPNEVEMAQATLRQMLDQGPREHLGVRYEDVDIHPESRLINPDHNQASLFLFCEREGWYQVTSDSPIFDRAA